MRLLLLLAGLVVGLAGCGELPQPFRHTESNPLLVIGSRAGVVVEPVADLPEWFSEALAEALRSYDVPAAVGLGHASSYLVHAEVTRQDEVVHLAWVVRDPRSQEIGRHDSRMAAAALDDPETLQALAAQVAAPLAATLAGPNVPQRPKPAVAVRPVQGATFDGNAVLTDAMRAALSAAGYPQGSAREQAELVIHGSVLVSPGRTGFQRVEVVWSVLRPGQARPVGSMRQANEVPFGALQLTWKPIVPEIVRAAVAGLDQLVRRTQRGG